jgi:hypothetical protein
MVHMRRAYLTLASCYAIVWCLPATLAALSNASESGSTPGYSYNNERLESCVGEFGCPTGPMNVGTILLVTALILIPSLMVALPLCVYLARKWQTPILAGFISTVAGLTALCLGGLVVFNVFAGS